MRRKCVSMLLAVVMVLSMLPGMAWAAEKETEKIAYPVTGGNIYISYDESNKVYYVSGCDSSVTEANIPSQVEGHTITEIGYDVGVRSDSNRVFSNRLTKVVIPASITHVYENAFDLCQNLTEIVVDAGNPDLSAEEGVLYNKDKTQIICYPTASGDYTVPAGVTSIGEFAFDSQKLTSVTFPESLKDIGAYAFSDCQELVSLTLPEGLTDIEACAFRGCRNLTSVKLPSTLISIGNSVFAYCQSLTQVTLPAAVTSIANAVFEGCQSLTQLTFPVSLTYIGSWVFDGCDNLTDIYYAGSEEQWKAIDFGYYYDDDLINVTIHYNSTGPDVPTAYPVTVASASHGSVTASPASAKAGEKVTLTAKPEQGYELSTLTVTDASGKAVATSKQSDGTYTFTMPASAVTVRASFQEAEQAGSELMIQFEFDTSKIADQILIIRVIGYMGSLKLLDIPIEIPLS